MVKGQSWTVWRQARKWRRSGAGRNGSRAGLLVPGRHGPGWRGRGSSSLARQGERPPPYVLHAKSSPALAPQFIACNTPRQFITLRAISIARNDCTQETARSRWRDAGKDQIGPKNWENAIEGPSLPCNFTPMGLPTHLGDVGLVIERVWWQRSRAGHARRSETPAAPNNAAPIDRRRPR